MQSKVDWKNRYDQWHWMKKVIAICDRVKNAKRKNYMFRLM